MTPVRFCFVSAMALLLTATGATAAPVSMAAGEWHRSNKVELASPLLSQLLGAALQSDVCISPAIASRGPLAIALVEDGPDCVTTNIKIEAATFTATRACRAKQGGSSVFTLSGRFSQNSISMEERSRTASGAPFNAHGDLRWVGPCRASTPPPGR